MYFEEFRNFVEKNSRAEDVFLMKALAYHTEKNVERKKANRWSQDKIDKECDKMWDVAILNAYTNIKDKIRADKNKPGFRTHDDEIDYWIEFMNEYEFIDSFIDGIEETEFE